MCLAKAYLEGEGEKELLLEEVALIEIDDKTLRLSTIFGERKEMEGVIKSVDFQNSTVIVEKPN